MPEIKVKISKGFVDFSSSSTNIQYNNLISLLSALAKAKIETNSSLTEIVENHKDIKTSRKAKAAEDDENSSSDDDDDSAKKKQKS